MEYEILDAQPADAPDILALQRLGYRSEAELYGDWTIAPLTQTLDELQEEFTRLTLLKAVARNAAPDSPLAGTVRAGLVDGVCHIGRLVVHPERQRQGLGSALLAAIEERFPQALRYALFTGSRSEGNLRLYRRHGYLPMRTQEGAPGLCLVFLEKPGRARP